MIKVQKKSQPQYANRGEGRQEKNNSGDLCGCGYRFMTSSRERAPLFYFRAPFEVWTRMSKSLREHADVTGKFGAEPITRSHNLGPEPL